MEHTRVCGYEIRNIKAGHPGLQVSHYTQPHQPTAGCYGVGCFAIGASETLSCSLSCHIVHARHSSVERLTLEESFARHHSYVQKRQLNCYRIFILAGSICLDSEPTEGRKAAPRAGLS